MRFTTFFVTLLLAFSASASVSVSVSNYKAYPSYEEVATYFVEHGKKDNSPAMQYTQTNSAAGAPQLRFEKRTTGWHVIQQRAGQSEDILLWDAAGTGFQEVTIFGEAPDLPILLQNWNARLFDLNPFFGYPSWELDVINYFEAKRSKHNENQPGSEKSAKQKLTAGGLEEEELYTLGRAYGTYGGNLLNNNSGFSDDSKRFDLPPGKNSMTTAQLAEYRSYLHKSIAAFEALAVRNPDFEMFVGGIETVAANKRLTAFLNLRIYQSEEEAVKELAAGLYPAHSLSMFRNILNSCEPNAILFTYGDTDTFCPLYLQSQYGLRKDVLIVNVNLMRIPRYLNSLREQILEAPPLPLSLTQEEVAALPPYGFALGEIGGNQIRLTELPALIRMMPMATQGEILSLPSNRFSMNTSDGLIEWSFPNSDEAGSADLNFAEEVNTIAPNQVMLYDIIGQNNWERPICFSSNAYRGLGLDDYIQGKGLISQLTAVAKPGAAAFGWIEPDQQYDLLMRQFDYDGLDRQLTPTENFIPNWHRLLFNQLAEELILASDKARALEVLDRSLELFPDAHFSYDHFVYPMVELFLRAGRSDRAVELAKRLQQNMKTGLIDGETAARIELALESLAISWEIPELRGETRD